MNPLTATQAWTDLLARVIYAGTDSSPRGMPIREILNSSVAVNMKHPIVLNKARKLNYRFMAAEAWWILSGRDDVESIGKYCKAITKFSDDGETFFGAYGPRIFNQLGSVVDKILQDPDTRQAVLTIWRKNPPETKDVPCTVSVQWLLRDGKLHCIDTMRSNDVWLGFPYDVFNFSMLSWHILDRLRGVLTQPLELGTLFLNAGSHHVYEPDSRKASLWTGGDWKLNHSFGGFVMGPDEPAGSERDSEISVCLGRILGEYPPQHLTDGLFFDEFSHLIETTQQQKEPK